MRHLAKAQGLFQRSVDMLELLNPTSITPSLKKFFEAVQSAVMADDGSTLAAMVEVRGFEKVEEMLTAEKDDKDQDATIKELAFKMQMEEGLQNLPDSVQLCFCSDKTSDLLRKFGVRIFKIPSLDKGDRTALLKRFMNDATAESIQKFLQGFSIREVRQLAKKI